MNGDIRPPKRPAVRQTPAHLPPPAQRGEMHQLPNEPALQPSHWSDQPGPELPPPVTVPLASKKRVRWPWLLGGLITIVLAAIAAAVIWYYSALRPVSSHAAEYQDVIIESGSTPRDIATQLYEAGLIRSELAFMIYTRLEGVQGSLQASNYRIAPSESLAEIVAHLLEGKAANFRITFYPGATLFDPTDIDDERRTDVYTMLRRAGYSDTEVRSGLTADYNHPLLADKPANASLEGYVFGETYQFDSSATVAEVLNHTFDVYYERIEKADILPRLDAVGMTLHEAIILASIIEREVSGQLEDQRIVSQIFHKRLDIGEPLGADATFMYVAQQRNVTPTISIDSPYNTRIHGGLPPGPISSPDIVALEAAVTPADTDYLYFVSGDDGKNHFARTNAEHVENTRRYCTTLCNEIAN